MNKQTSLRHPIQQYVVSVLTRKATARFSELRPLETDTNVFSYHLKLLIRDRFITKLDKTYMLSSEGLAYVDQLGGESRQPKVLTMLLIQNSEGEVLLQKREKQPYINSWTLPCDKVLASDISIRAAATRGALEKLGLQGPEMRHVGDCYIRVRTEGTLLSTTLVHIFRYEIDGMFPEESFMWMGPLKLSRYSLAPAVEQIVARSFFGDDHFFAEFEHEWSVVTS